MAKLYIETDSIEKLIWSENDFQNMGWHDASLWSMLADPNNYQYLFDLDYIFEWIQ